MLNKYEKAELVEDLTIKESAGYYRNGYSRACSPVNLRRLASFRYKKAGVDVLPRHVSRMLAAIVEYEMYKMPKSIKFKIRELINIDLLRYYPKDRKWVLRNLTTHEFIRAEALAGNSEQNRPYIRDLEFEHIVLSRIFWSLLSGSTIFSGRSVNRET